MKYCRETIAVAQRILIELLRRRRSLIFWSIFPISVLILNGLIIAERAKISMDAAFNYAAPATLVGAALFFSCLGGSVATVVSEREQQTLKRLFISPLSGTSYFLGIFLAHSCIGIGQTLLVYTIAAFWGATFNGSIFLGLTIILISIISYVGLGFILGTQLARRTEDVNSLVAAFGVPLLILGGAFIPASLFPKTLINLANYNPIYHAIKALVAVSSQGNELEDITSHFWFLTGFAAIMVVGGWLSYQRMLMVERRL
ncbi:MAG: ABC transporter permease [Cyanomargarita calcarea GSE-NOS-MK-12-04C]|jgi:ABC-2 type transport system permease protein|uniref:Transport permease protein n=1 Tax=Cyanomargarita calcarea GSE-NOS-MK-12-04C TaxID=2839659 RepID=A0A951QXI7_9CYAN|nr:ABC transporter permease [Cyanomargarita calcarea GSE-NOS-MK-12-04C]